MRIALLAIASIAAPITAAFADPRSDSLALYETMTEAATRFQEARKLAGGDAKLALQMLNDGVRLPLSAATERWRKIHDAQANPLPWDPFVVCRDAALDLKDMSETSMRSLDNGDYSASALGETQWFRVDYTQCELALSLDPTFDGKK